MNDTSVPLSLTKVNGFPNRRQGTISRHPSDGSEPTLHLVTIVSEKVEGRTKHKVYVSVEGSNLFAGSVTSHGVGRWMIGVRQPNKSSYGTFTDSGTMIRWVEYVAHGFLNQRDYAKSQKAGQA